MYVLTHRAPSITQTCNTQCQSRSTQGATRAHTPMPAWSCRMSCFACECASHRAGTGHGRGTSCCRGGTCSTDSFSPSPSASQQCACHMLQRHVATRCSMLRGVWLYTACCMLQHVACCMPHGLLCASVAHRPHPAQIMRRPHGHRVVRDALWSTQDIYRAGYRLVVRRCRARIRRPSRM